MLRRSPLRRSTVLAHTEVRPKVCEACGREFFPFLPLATVCSPRCAGRKVKADKKAEKEDFKRRKEALKRIPDLIADADKAFADFIRTRDRLAGYPCISSGKPLDWSGNQVDAGHYRSRGAASHLRYHEDNCHAQSKHDNQWRAGNVVEYRIRLVQRIGLERVEALEADNHVHLWAREELIALKDEYRAKLKALKQEAA